VVGDEVGTRKGGDLALLANIYLHYVLDQWVVWCASDTRLGTWYGPLRG